MHRMSHIKSIINYIFQQFSNEIYNLNYFVGSTDRPLTIFRIFNIKNRVTGKFLLQTDIFREKFGIDISMAPKMAIKDFCL
jgi:hypothetical protein